MPGSPHDVRDITTGRLALTPASLADLNEIYALHGDERVWRHRPDGRHTSVEYSRGKLDQMVAQWACDGLGYWCARLRSPLAGMPAGEFVGVGGCALDAGNGWWNLYYRFRPEAQGHRLAAELADAAVTAAHAVNADLPVIASLVETNRASARTAEHVGLRLQWRDEDGDDPSSIRVVYADRDVELTTAGSQALKKTQR